MVHEAPFETQEIPESDTYLFPWMLPFPPPPILAMYDEGKFCFLWQYLFCLLVPGFQLWVLWSGNASWFKCLSPHFQSLIVKLMQYKSSIFMQRLYTVQTEPSGQTSICLFALMGGLLIRSYSQMMSCRVGEGRWPNSDQKKRVCMDLVLTRG